MTERPLLLSMRPAWSGPSLGRNKPRAILQATIGIPSTATQYSVQKREKYSVQEIDGHKSISCMAVPADRGDQVAMEIYQPGLMRGCGLPAEVPSLDRTRKV